jgi:hypothetical protein
MTRQDTIADRRDQRMVKPFFSAKAVLAPASAKHAQYAETAVDLKADRKLACRLFTRRTTI